MRSDEVRIKSAAVLTIQNPPISIRGEFKGLVRSLKLMVRLGHTLNVTLAVGAAMLAGSSLDLAQFMESQAQTLFYVLRGPLTPTTAVTSMQSAWLA